ncbi:extracellular solute-binding protein [uncultured Sphaerochaeta sp.]|uniref:extracellular solute-binding protein n=1 Tax=uncultured Sphaerochaeta sp. TaxID=886478 RepID=UPI002A0A9D41|nr:extracellular solute-binding protein [uncultured Sphaerochaeta sp.]
MHKTNIRMLVLCSLIASMALIGCKKSNLVNGKLYLYNWTYYTPDSVIEQFEKETGIDVIIDNFASNEEMFAKVMAGGNEGYDIIFPSSDYTSIMIKLGMLEEIDHSKVPNLKYINPLIKEKATYDSNFRYSVPYFMGSSGIAVNKAYAPANYNKDWSIFADKRMAGRMSMLDDMREVMGGALKYLGYSGNTTDEAQLQQALDLIVNEWKPNIVKFDSESFAKSFARGEFWVSQCYPENVFSEIPEEKWGDIDFFIPPEGGMMYIDNMVIPKGSRNYDSALKFINFIHRPEIYAEFLDEFGFPPTTNTKAEKYMKNHNYFFTAEDMKNSDNIMDLGIDLEKYNNIWQTIRYQM